MAMDAAQLDQLERILTFNQVGLRIQEQLNVEDIFRIIGEGLKEIGLNCGIMLLDEEHENLQLKYISTLPSLVTKVEKLLGIKAVGFQIPVESEVVVMTAIRERRAIHTTKAVDIIKEMLPSIRRTPLLGQVAKMLGLVHCIAAPLVARGEIFGALAVYSHNIPEEDIPIVVAFANQAAIAIDNAARLPLEFEARAKELKESEEKFRQLLEEMNDGYIVVNHEGSINFANSKFGEIFGYEPGQVVGKSLSEFVLPERSEAVRKEYQRVIRGEEKSAEQREAVGMKRDGSTIVIESNVKAIEYEGKPAFSVIVRDITDRKESEKKYRELIEDINDGYIVYQDEVIVIANQRFAEIFGYTIAQVLGKDLFTFIEPANLSMIMEKYTSIISGEVKTPERYELEGMRGDGTKITVDLSIKAIEYEGKPAYSVIFRDITEQKQSKKNYKQLLEDIHDGYAVMQEDGEIIYANEKYAEIFGYEPGQVIGYVFPQFIAPDNLLEILDKYSRVITNKEEIPERIEITGMKKDGSTIPIEGGIKSIQYQGKRAYAVIVRDITERKQAQESLQRSEEHFRLLIENIHDVILVLGANGTIRYTSPSIERMLGYKRRELSGKQAFDYFHQEDTSCLLDAFNKVIQTPGHIESIEARVCHKDGSWLDIEGTGISLLNEPSVAGVVINFRDITDRKQVREELQRSEEYFRSLIENSYDVIVIENADGTIRYVSRAIEQVLGYKQEEWIGKQFFDLIHPDELQNIIDMFTEAVKAPGHIGSMVVKLQHKDGSWRTVEGTGNNLLFNPSVSGVVCNFHDITERKQMEEALIESQEMYRSMVETADKAGEGIMIAQNIGDVEGVIVFANDEVLRITGYSREEFIGSTVQNLLPPDNISDLMARYKRRQDGEELSGYQELWINRKDGTSVPIEICAGIMTYQGRVSTMAYIRDITEAKRIEKELQRSKEQFKTLIENAFDTIVVVKADQSISYVSPSIKRSLGYEQEEFMSKDLLSRAHPDDFPRVVDAFTKVMQKPGNIASLVVNVRHKDGSWRTTEGIATNLMDHPAIEGIVINFRDITEAKRIEEELQHSKEQFQALIENAFDTIVVVKADQSIGYVSPSIKRSLGFEVEEYMGKNLFYRSHPDELPKIIDTFTEVMHQPGNAAFMEMLAKHKDGSWRTIEGIATNLMDHPAIEGIVINFRDITDRKQMEDKHRQLVEDMNDGYVVIQDGECVLANRRFGEMMGYEPEQVLGQNLSRFVAPDSLKTVLDEYVRISSDEEETPERYEVEGIKGDGTKIILDLSVKTTEYEGKPAFGTIVRDITERKQAEELLQRKEEHFRLLTENSYDVIVVLSADGTISYSSPSGERVLGYKPEEAVGMKAHSFIHPEDLPPFVVSLGKAITMPGFSKSMEVRLQHKDGSWRYVEGTGISLLSEPSVAGIVIHYRDITERKQADEQLKEYSENLERMVEERTRELKDAQDKIVRTEKLAAIGELAGSMAHELRNPLGAVKASTHFLKMRMKGTTDEKLTKHLDILEKQADICNNTISDLLDFSRPAKVEIVKVNISQLVREVVRNTKIPQNIEVSTGLAKDLAPVMADRDHLERVFSNLIANSIESMPDGGKLSLNTIQNMHFIEVKITDTGMGIPEENLDKVFEPLFTTKAKGVGLGLSLTKALIEKQDGAIDVQSQIGEGTTFTVKLPIAGNE